MHLIEHGCFILKYCFHTYFNSSSNCHIFSCFFLIMLQTISPFKCSKWNCSFLKHVFKLFNFHLWRTINISNIFMQAFKRVRLRVIEKIKSKYAENQMRSGYLGYKIKFMRDMKKMIVFWFSSSVISNTVVKWNE